MGDYKAQSTQRWNRVQAGAIAGYDMESPAGIGVFLIRRHMPNSVPASRDLSLGEHRHSIVQSNVEVVQPLRTAWNAAGSLAIPIRHHFHVDTSQIHHLSDQGGCPSLSGYCLQGKIMR